MGAEELLFWLSARQAGSWSQFRPAVQTFISDEGSAEGSAELLPVYLRVRLNLEQLGHVEFDTPGCEGGWRVAPPVLALSERKGKTIGIVCGARLPVLGRDLERGIPEIRVERHEGPEYPAVIRLIADDVRQLELVAERAGVALQRHAALSLLSCLPSITGLSAWRSRCADLPFGKNTTVSRLELGRGGCRWVDSSVGEAGNTARGLFRFTRFRQQEHYLRLASETFRVPAQVGKYFLVAGRNRQVLRYSRLSRELRVPAVLRPPLLVDRALVLCSGFLPRHDPSASTLTYTEIPEGIAGMAARVLCQRHL